MDRYRWRVNARSGSVLDGRRFPGELIFYGSKGFFGRGLAWFRSLRFRWVTRRDRGEDSGPRLSHSSGHWRFQHGR